MSGGRPLVPRETALTHAISKRNPMPLQKRKPAAIGDMAHFLRFVQGGRRKPKVTLPKLGGT